MRTPPDIPLQLKFPPFINRLWSSPNGKGGFPKKPRAPSKVSIKSISDTGVKFADLCISRDAQFAI